MFQNVSVWMFQFECYPNPSGAGKKYHRSEPPRFNAWIATKNVYIICWDIVRISIVLMHVWMTLFYETLEKHLFKISLTACHRWSYCQSLLKFVKLHHAHSFKNVSQGIVITKKHEPAVNPYACGHVILFCFRWSLPCRAVVVVIVVAFVPGVFSWNFRVGIVFVITVVVAFVHGVLCASTFSVWSTFNESTFSVEIHNKSPIYLTF